MLDSIRRPNITTNYSRNKEDYHYVSYNCIDVDVYGDVTTALVFGSVFHIFLILFGDHREQYDKLSSLSERVDYFLKNKDKASEMGNDIPEKSDLVYLQKFELEEQQKYRKLLESLGDK